MWRGLLRVFDEGGGLPSDIDKKTVHSIVESCFVFASVWSLCVSINTEFRRPFDL